MQIKKRCPGCEMWLDPSAFSKDRARADGRQNYCKRCRTLVEAASRAERRDRLQASGFAGCKHGTVGTYQDGCRCDECRKAWSEYMKAYKRKRKESDIICEANE